MTDQDSKTQPVEKRKPGPEPERVKIEGDPEEALRKLLSTPPPDDDVEPVEGEEPQPA